MTTPSPTEGLPARRRPDLFLVAVILVYILVRAASLLRWDLWFDELFGVGLGYLSWGEMLARAAADQTNPPFFYMVLKGWMALGNDGPFWLRLLPFLTSVATLSPLLLLFRRLQLPPLTQRIALVLAASSPLLVFYSVELRAYALLTLLGTAAAAELVELLGPGEVRRDTLIRLALWNLLLPLTHYYGWFTIGAEGIAILLWRRDRWKEGALVFAPAVFAFLPWVYAVKSTVHVGTPVAPTIAWIARPGIAALSDFPIFLLTEQWSWVDHLALPVLVIGTGLAIWKGRRDQAAPPRAAEMLAVLVVVPIACGFFGSLLLPRSIWGPRYLSVVAIPALILIAMGLAALPRPAQGIAALALVLLGVRGNARADDAKIRWHDLTARLGAQAVPVYVFESFTALPIRYYDGLADAKLDVRMIRTPDDLHERAGWIVVRGTEWPGGNDGSDAIRRWGFTVTDSTTATAWGEEIRAWRFRR